MYKLYNKTLNRFPAIWEPVLSLTAFKLKQNIVKHDLKNLTCGKQTPFVYRSDHIILCFGVWVRTNCGYLLAVGFTSLLLVKCSFNYNLHHLVPRRIDARLCLPDIINTKVPCVWLIINRGSTKTESFQANPHPLEPAQNCSFYC